MIKAVIFDIDGTLIDSVDLHAESWSRAFEHFGMHADAGAIRGQIGKAAHALIKSFASDMPEDRMRKIEQFRSELFIRDYLDRVRGFPRVPDLFRLIRSRGQRTALASSCKESEIGRYMEIAGITGLVDARATSDDADCSKPAPDIFQACCSRLSGIGAAEAVVVGDSSYDAEAALRAGMIAVGLLCGAATEQELREAGCVAIYRDPEDLLRQYDQSPLCTGRQQKRELPSAGPHARPSLMNPELTPGSGALPPVGDDGDGNVQPTS